MSYSTLDLELVEVGKPVRKSIMTTLQGNQEDHESRMLSVENISSKIISFDFQIVGFISNYKVSGLKAVANHTVPANYTLQEMSVVILDSPNTFDSSGNIAETSSAGKLEVDLLRSTDGGITFDSILTTLPAIPAGYNGKGTGSNSTGCVSTVFATTEILADQILQINITSLKDEQGSFKITCYGSVT